MLFPSLCISIYEILCSFLHSAYRYIKHCVSSFIQRIDIWNSVLIPSFDISIYETLSWFLHSTYRYTKICVEHIRKHSYMWYVFRSLSAALPCTKHVESFSHYIDIYNMLWNFFRQPSFISRHDNLVPRYVQFKVYKTSSIVRHVGRQIKHVATLSINWYKMYSMSLAAFSCPRPHLS